LIRAILSPKIFISCKAALNRCGASARRSPLSGVKVATSY
jgi:hypothetical protein